MKKQQPLPSGLQSALITALEFIRVVVTDMPRTRERVLTAMDLSDEGFDDEIDTLENLLASLSPQDSPRYDRMVPRLANKRVQEE
jgi:hypothetical protein